MFVAGISRAATRKFVDLALASCWKTSASLRTINLSYHRLNIYNRSSIDRFDGPNQQPVLDDFPHSHQMQTQWVGAVRRSRRENTSKWPAPVRAWVNF